MPPAFHDMMESCGLAVMFVVYFGLIYFFEMEAAELLELLYEFLSWLVLSQYQDDGLDEVVEI